MVEVVGGIVAHTQPLHHSAGLIVDCSRERDDLVAAESIKAEGQRRAGRLGCIAVTPVATVKPPSNLNGWREVRFEPRLIEPDKTDERSDIDELDGPQSPTLAGDHGLNMGGELVALRLGQRRWEVPHDLGIRVESCERIEIGLPPLSEQKTWRRELRHRVIVTVSTRRLRLAATDRALIAGATRARSWPGIESALIIGRASASSGSHLSEHPPVLART